MERRDLAAVLALEAAVYPQPWSERTFREELDLANRRYVVAVDAGLVVGYGGLLIVEPDAHITTLAVDPRSRRSRLGTRLMLRLVDEALAGGAHHLTLEVRVSNEAAQRLYERFGFAPVGRRKDYYRDEDALIMWATEIDDEDYAERLAAIRAELEGGVPSPRH
jgi:ribosomal-protein-alanine N-acetyltransferase